LNGQVCIDAESPEPAWFGSEAIQLPFDWHPLAITFTKTSRQARISLYWSGPQFQLEPISGRQFFHEPADSPHDDFARGSQLVRALRCGACHHIPGEPATLAAPDLTSVAGNLQREWIVEWLAADESKSNIPSDRRMPHFAFHQGDAEAIAAYLTHVPEQSTRDAKGSEQADLGRLEADPTAGRAKGEDLFLTIGCLACHRRSAASDRPTFSSAGCPPRPKSNPNIACRCFPFLPSSAAIFRRTWCRSRQHQVRRPTSAPPLRKSHVDASWSK
jgi:mono/diheme cytochrome c family protein